MLTACISIRLHRFKGLVPKKTAFTSNASPNLAEGSPRSPGYKFRHCPYPLRLAHRPQESTAIVIPAFLYRMHRAQGLKEHSASLPLVVTSAHISVLTSREGPLTFSVQGFHWDSITMACLLSHWPHVSLIASPLFLPFLQRSSV